MADNTFNFDLDAPAVPTLTLDPAPAACSDWILFWQRCFYDKRL